MVLNAKKRGEIVTSAELDNLLKRIEAFDLGALLASLEALDLEALLAELSAEQDRVIASIAHAEINAAEVER